MDGKNVSVIVPIDLWREIESEIETACLLTGPTMKARLIQAKDRTGGMSLDEVADRLGIRSRRLWGSRTIALRIVKLVREVGRTPFEGTGKPEPLKHELEGCGSRRITQEHRRVYPVQGGKDSHPRVPPP